MPSGAGFKRLSDTFEDLKKELPAGLGAKPKEETKPATNPTEAPPLPVKVVDDGKAIHWNSFNPWHHRFLGPLGTAALVLLLVTFMLLKHEDLRSRFIRLMGQGRISSTTRALDDAGMRIRRYLLMQLVVNLVYGFSLCIGLYFIGVPNALLWGALAAGLRFIPYIGPWIAASFPMLLSLAVSPSWLTPALTLGLFIAIELVTNNVLEPWLYGSSTGVSSIALIVAAVFWTWLWGPVGLVLSTPLTVCLVVMGRHIPQLSFLSVLLSEEDALTPAEDFYHRLLRRGEHDESDQIEAYLKENSLNDLYDSVLIPVMIAAEADYARGMVDEEQREWVVRALHSIVEDLDHGEPSTTTDPSSQPVCRVYCLPARAERDELVGAMLANALHHEGFDARHAVGRRMAEGLVAQFSDDPTDVVFISAVEPTTANHARALCEKIRASVPDQKVVVGLWGRLGDIEHVTEELKLSGADEVFATIAEAVAFCEGFALQWADDVMEAPRPDNEAERQHSLDQLDLLSPEPMPALDRLTAKLARVFEVPVASVTLVDEHRQFFRANSGLPSNLRETPRDLSVCGHVVYQDELMVVEDLLRDRRFANNLFLKQHGIRFYAGAPIHSSDGQAIGALCLMDTKPRRFTKRERRLLAEHAAELSREIGQLPGYCLAGLVGFSHHGSVPHDTQTSCFLRARPILAGQSPHPFHEIGRRARSRGSLPPLPGPGLRLSGPHRSLHRPL
ncbi:MAG: AI-2E family transporter [Luteolibacter sp.]